MGYGSPDLKVYPFHCTLARLIDVANLLHLGDDIRHIDELVRHISSCQYYVKTGFPLAYRL